MRQTHTMPTTMTKKPDNISTPIMSTVQLFSAIKQADNNDPFEL